MQCVFVIRLVNHQQCFLRCGLHNAAESCGVQHAAYRIGWIAEHRHLWCRPLSQGRYPGIHIELQRWRDRQHLHARTHHAWVDFVQTKRGQQRDHAIARLQEGLTQHLQQVFRTIAHHHLVWLRTCALGNGRAQCPAIGVWVQARL